MCYIKILKSGMCPVICVVHCVSSCHVSPFLKYEWRDLSKSETTLITNPWTRSRTITEINTEQTVRERNHERTPIATCTKNKSQPKAHLGSRVFVVANALRRSGGNCHYTVYSSNFTSRSVRSQGSSLVYLFDKVTFKPIILTMVSSSSFLDF